MRTLAYNFSWPTIHICICTVYIPILYLFYTCILYFFTVLYFNKKYIWSNLLFYTCLVSMPPSCLHDSVCIATFQDITCAHLFRIKTNRSRVYHVHAHAHVHWKLSFVEFHLIFRTKIS